jgi:methanogenic corrinoid protein MtbC1
MGRIWLGAPPDEQHTLGLILVSEFFVRSGWSVQMMNPVSETSDYLAPIAAEWFDLVGFSVSCNSNLPRLYRTIRTVREVSRNRDVKILVGGWVFRDAPDLVARLGADGGAPDAREAVDVARSFL